MKKEELLRRIDEGKISFEEIKSENYDFDIILQMFNFFMENEAMQLATPEQQKYLLSNMGCYNAKLYRQLAPYIKPEIWADSKLAYMILARCAPDFSSSDEYIREFQKYVPLIKKAEVENNAMLGVCSGDSEEEVRAHQVLKLLKITTSQN